MQDILNFAHELAWKAGKITLRYFQTEITTDRKSDHSPVTIADRETERYLRHLSSRVIQNMRSLAKKMD